MKQIYFVIVGCLLLPAISSYAAADSLIPVQSVLTRVLEEAEVPAREAGVLAKFIVREGDRVTAGQVIGQLDDEDAQLAVARAVLELAIAAKQVENSLPIKVAESLLKEAEQDRKQVDLTQRIASRRSDSDVSVRHALKSRDAAKADLDRAMAARKDFAKSVSQTEVDRLRLIVEKHDLEIEKAEFEKELANLQKQIEDSTILEQDQTVERLTLSIEQARLQKEIDGLARDLKARQLDQAKLHVQRRQICSPLDGVVVEVFRHQGEWLEPGQRVLRIVRLDRLRVEGFVDAKRIRGEMRDAPVRVDVELADEIKAKVKGKIIFVSPEVDPVNGQVRVWAEVENPDFKLRPGLRAEMLIDVMGKK
ncbi:MAG: HlyD family efflux transporter periplasmic adaptor subunit [Planctomycetia bacterium]|nr:HlyD family efflux transporter periplasmic adaptor subunit [Planctomycetia bacterium]